MADYFVWDEEFPLNVSRGKVRGASVIHKFGAVPSMATNTTGTIWDIDDTLYPWSAFNTAGVLVAAVVNVADNGHVIRVEGLDENYEEVSEDFTVSSSGTVTGTVSFKRVYRAYVTDNGGTNVGDITFTKGGTNVLRIKAGKGQTLMSVYTVTAGCSAYIKQIACSAQVGADATIDIIVRNTAGIERVQASFEVTGAGGPYINQFYYPLSVPEKTDIEFRATTRSNNGRYTATFDMIIIREAVNVN
tara:strand:+ start:553 stop:1290 length:738 start_codon:yes stop_codon:yes gene_type:complete